MRVIWMLVVLLAGHLRTSRKRGSHNEKTHGTRAGFGADGPKAFRKRQADKGRKIAGAKPAGEPSPEALREIEKHEASIRNLQTHEESVLVDNDGNLIARTRGTEHSVFTSPSDLLEVRDGKGVMTHNHPGGQLGETSFSVADFEHFLNWRPAEFRAVTPNYTFRLKGPEGGWGNRERPKFGSKQVQRDYEAIFPVIEMKRRKWQEEGKTTKEIDFLQTNEHAKMLARAYGLRYSVDKV